MMRDPAGVPVWLQIVALAVWMCGLGVWVERNRFGGTRDLHDQVTELEARNDELLATVDDLVATNARSRIEIVTRRRAAMPHLAAVGDHRDLHVIEGGRT